MNRTTTGRIIWGGVFFGAALASAGCGGASGEPAATAEPGEESEAQPASEDLVARFQRERAEPWKEVKASDPGGAWSARIESMAPARVEQQQGVVVVQADLGEADPFSCVVYPEPIDAGSVIQAVLAEAQQKIEIKKVAAYSVGVVAHAPAVFVRALYHSQVDGQLAMGDLKMMVVSRLEHPVFCTLDVPGYAETFTRLGSGFAGSFEWKSPPPSPRRTEVWAAAIDGAPIGFQSVVFVDEPERRLRAVTLTTLLIPTSDTHLHVVDTATVMRSGADGRLVEGRWLKTENAEARFDLELKGKGTRYQYQGQVLGKDVKGSFQTKQGLSTASDLMSRLAKVRAQGKAQKFQVEEYHPGVDPTQATKVNYDFVSPEGGGKLTVGMGDVSFDLALSEDGYPHLMVMPVDRSLDLVIKRVDAVGAF